MAAIMSTADSYMLTGATNISVDNLGSGGPAF